MPVSQLTGRSAVLPLSPPLSEWQEGGDDYVIEKEKKNGFVLEVLQREQASDQVVSSLESSAITSSTVVRQTLHLSGTPDSSFSPDLEMVISDDSGIPGPADSLSDAIQSTPLSMESDVPGETMTEKHSALDTDMPLWYVDTSEFSIASSFPCHQGISISGHLEYTLMSSYGLSVSIPTSQQSIIGCTVSDCPDLEKAPLDGSGSCVLGPRNDTLY